MPENQSTLSVINVVSIVEALSVTGPVKPLLMFAKLAQHGLPNRRRTNHTLLTTRRNLSAPDLLHSAAIEAGLDFAVVHERFAFDPKILASLRKEILLRSPHIIETHDCKSHFLLLLLRARYPILRKAKWIAFHHGYTKTSWKIALYQQLDRLSLPRADHVITLCKPFASMLERRGVHKDKLEVISNAVARTKPPSNADLEKFRHGLGIQDDEYVIASVGRLSIEKAQDELIAAFAVLCNQHSQVRMRLLIAGDGPERDRLKLLANPLGEKVIFTGHLQDPIQVFYAADIFALTSHSEGSPLVIFEAMEAGCAIVATAVGGVPETLKDEESALLIQPKNEVALVAAMERLITNESLRADIANNAQAELKRFSPEKYSEKLLNIYSQLGVN